MMGTCSSRRRRGDAHGWRIERTGGIERGFWRLLLLLAVGFSSLAHGAQELTFDVREVVERNPDPTTDSGTVEEQANYELKVVLGPDFIEYRGGPSGHRILDFGRERLYFREEGETKYTSTSIYSDLGFRLYEFQNRLFLNSLITRVGAREKERWSPVYPEHLFSLRSETEAEIERRETRRFLTYSFGKDLLFRHSLQTVPVETEVLRRFVVFLRNAYGIHPDILDRVEQLEGLPRQMELAVFDFESARRVLQLRSVDELDGSTVMSSIEAVSRAGEERLKPISGAAWEASDDALQARLDELVLDARRLAADGRFLDAMLLFFEYTLCTGEELPAEFFEHRASIMTDPDVVALFTALEARGTDERKQAMEALRRLELVADQGKRSLRIFLANTLAALGESVEAKELFLAALRQNPFIAGAWKDLGDIYYGEYDTQSAWLCWDTGRALEPSAKLFQQVYEFEETLRADHPEFFLQLEDR